LTWPFCSITIHFIYIVLVGVLYIKQTFLI